MADWVLDECVFKVAHDQHHSKCRDALYLTEVISRFHKLVLDHECVLLKRYQKYFEKNKLLKSWYADLVKKANHIEYRSSKLNEQVDTNLTNLRFDNDDKCYVGVALNSDGIIISEDSDFFQPAIKEYFIKNLDLEVFCICDAIKEEAKKRN